MSLSHYSFLQVVVITKIENSLGYIGGQVNSLTGLPSLHLIRAKSFVEDGLATYLSFRFGHKIISAWTLSTG